MAAILGGLSPLFVGTIAAYFLVILGIGYWGYRSTQPTGKYSGEPS